jgi:hypothetical protein
LCVGITEHARYGTTLRALPSRYGFPCSPTIDAINGRIGWKKSELLKRSLQRYVAVYWPICFLRERRCEA